MGILLQIASYNEQLSKIGPLEELVMDLLFALLTGAVPQQPPTCTLNLIESTELMVIRAGLIKKTWVNFGAAKATKPARVVFEPA